MIQNLILSIGLSFAIGLNGAKDNNHNFINNDTPNNVVYDDEEYQITLTAEELNNYTWHYFYNFLNNRVNDSLNFQNISFANQYSNFDTDIYDVDGAYFYEDSEGASIFFLYDYEQYNLANGTTLNKNYVIYDDDPPFEISLSIVCSNSNYNDVKNAIELDIQANTTQASMGNSIINAIKSGLGLIGDLASQFLLGFSTLFWNNTTNTLTTFGTFALVFLGVAITMAVISLVLNIIRGNTGA